MPRFGRCVALATMLALTLATAAEAGPVKDARYRVRHGGKVALRYFERKGTFERFNSGKADRLEPNLAWVDHREPTDGGQVDIEFSGARRLLLITRTLGGRWFCTVTTRSGDQTAGAGASLSSIDTKSECIGA
jgi:hypothetical protein